MNPMDVEEGQNVPQNNQVVAGQNQVNLAGIANLIQSKKHFNNVYHGLRRLV